MARGEKLTPRQEKFAQLVASGKGVNEAYKKAGYSLTPKQAKIGSSASILHRQLKVIERIAELRDKTARKFEITRDSLVRDLLECRQVALTATPPQVSAAVGALVAIGKLLGFDRQQVDLIIHRPGFNATTLELEESEWARQFDPLSLPAPTSSNGHASARRDTPKRRDTEPSAASPQTED